MGSEQPHDDAYCDDRVFVSFKPRAERRGFADAEAWRQAAAMWAEEWCEQQARARSHAGAARSSSKPVDLHERSLRLALAMRGGVSLAVWIGGAVAELDFVRSLRVFKGVNGVTLAMAWDGDEPPTTAVKQRAFRYACLLAKRGFHRVELDVFAGASAGGLNSVLAAVAQRAGRSVEGALETWEQAGSLHRLLRAEGGASLESVLNGDGYFYERVLDRLVTFYEDPPANGAAPDPSDLLLPHPGLATDGVSVHLSATVANAQESEIPEIREGHAGFRFQVGVEGADVPSHEDQRDRRAASLRRLALAARTTSSFPGAFEPATVWSLGRKHRDDNDPSREGAPQLDNTSPKNLDMSAAFIAHREDKTRGPFRVIDGGLFDNIPIERAFRAIPLQKSEHPVRRWLGYLDPSPPPPPELARPRSDRLNDLIAVLAKTFSAKRHESEREDKSEMHAFMQKYELRLGLYDVLAVMQSEQIDVEGLQLGYARSRANADAILLTEVLANPELWQLEQNLVPRRSFLDGQDEGFRRDPRSYALDSVRQMGLVDWVNDLTVANADRVSGDPGAAREAALWLLECIQWLEIVLRTVPDAPQIDLEVRRELRARLYEVVESCEGLIRDRLLRMVEGFRSSCRHDTDYPQLWWPEQPEPALAELWNVLGEQLGTLAHALEQWVAALPEHDDQQQGSSWISASARRWWEEAPWKILCRIAVPPYSSAWAARLIAPAFTIIGAPEGHEAPTFFQIDGEWRCGPASADSKLRAPNARLRKLYEQSVMQQVLRDRDDTRYAAALVEQLEDWDRIPASSRLCGAQLKNFGGFASTDWRTADWWWGRMDAASALAIRLESVEATAAQQPESQPVPDLSPAAFAENVAAEFLAEHGEPGAADGRLEQLLTGRQGGLQRLEGNYRVSVVHRALRLAVRALYRVDARMKALVLPITHLLVPLLVFLPAAIQLPRLISASAVLLTGVVLARAGAAGGEGTASAALLVLLSAATAGLAIVAGKSTDSRWKVLLDSFIGYVEESELVELRRRARLRSYACGAGSALALGIAWLSWWLLDDGVVAVLYGMVAAVLMAVAVFGVGRRVHADPPAGARGRSPGFKLLAASALLLFAVAPGLGWLLRGAALQSGALWQQLWICGALAVTGAVLCWGVVGLPRARRREQPSGDEPQSPEPALSRWVEIGGPILAALAAALAFCVMLLGDRLNGGEPSGWSWFFAVLVWANALWCIPAWLTLETRAWSDDSIFSPTRAPSQGPAAARSLG